MKKTKLIEIAVKMIVAALTAFLTALTTTSCMGYGPGTDDDLVYGLRPVLSASLA